MTMRALVYSAYSPVASRLVFSSSILGYVAALVNLWDCQKAMGRNSFPTPRTNAVNSILRAIDRVRNARRILNFEDMGDDESCFNAFYVTLPMLLIQICTMTASAQSRA